jgi:hypothetical protein
MFQSKLIDKTLNSINHWIETSIHAKKYARNAFYASLVSWILTIIYWFYIALYSTWFIDAEMIGYVIAWVLVIILGLLTLGMSLIWSILLCLLLFVNIIISFIDWSWTIWIGGILLLYFYWYWVIACYLYPKLLNKEWWEIVSNKKTRIWILLTIIFVVGWGFLLLKSLFVLNPSLEKYPEIQKAWEIYREYSTFSIQKSQSIYDAQLKKDVSKQLSDINDLNEKRLETIIQLKKLLLEIQTKTENEYKSSIDVLQWVLNSLEDWEAKVIEIQKKIAEASSKIWWKKEIEILEQQMYDIMDWVYDVKDKRDSYLENVR